MKNYEFWFVVGSQTLYGEEVLETVARRADEMAAKLSAALPYPLIYKVTAKSNNEIIDVVREANYCDSCAGVITWCHTFSPSKMWINGLELLQKPWCHFATQYNREIPNNEIDMDFMNLNQAAHGDREHGFIGARLRIPRKIIAGYWENEDVQARLGSWMRAAVGAAFSRSLKVMRFGDNMREVAVTEGDKVEVQRKLGWQVNTWAVGDLVREMDAVTETDIDALMDEYRAAYDFSSDNIDAIRYQAREEQARAKQAAAEEILSLPTLNLKTNDAGLTDDQIAILRTLKDGALQVDDLIEKTQIPTRRVLSALTMMELEGYVEQGSGKHFSLTVTLLEE